MNKFVAIFVLFAVFAAATAQIIYSSPLTYNGHYAAAPLTAYTAPLATEPLASAWTSHYGAPLTYATAWKK